MRANHWGAPKNQSCGLGASGCGGRPREVAEEDGLGLCGYAYV